MCYKMRTTQERHIKSLAGSFIYVTQRLFCSFFFSFLKGLLEAALSRIQHQSQIRSLSYNKGTAVCTLCYMPTREEINLSLVLNRHYPFPHPDAGSPRPNVQYTAKQLVDQETIISIPQASCLHRSISHCVLFTPVQSLSPWLTSCSLPPQSCWVTSRPPRCARASSKERPMDWRLRHGAAQQQTHGLQQTSRTNAP